MAGTSSTTPVTSPASRPRRRRAAVALAAAVVAAGIGAGAAYGYFLGTGSRSAAASVGAMQSATLVPATGSPSTPLYPGGTADVILNVANPNPYPVTLSQVALSNSGTITADGGHPGCTTTGVSFTTQTPGTTIPADTATSGYPNGFPVDLVGAASMSAASPSGCQGAIFSIPVTITVRRG